MHLIEWFEHVILFFHIDEEVLFKSFGKPWINFYRPQSHVAACVLTLFISHLTCFCVIKLLFTLAKVAFTLQAML